MLVHVNMNIDSMTCINVVLTVPLNSASHEHCQLDCNQWVYV